MVVFENLLIFSELLKNNDIHFKAGIHYTTLKSEQISKTSYTYPLGKWGQRKTGHHTLQDRGSPHYQTLMLFRSRQTHAETCALLLGDA